VAQALPQDPQCALLLCASTQAPAQKVCPEAQRSRHAPLVQVRPTPQALPQAPQLASSVWRFTSQPELGLLSQSAKPEAQAMLQRPVVQLRVALAPVAQTVPQAPQVAGSLWRSTQEFPQRTWFVAQPEMHTGVMPAVEHRGVPLPHARPQAPQLREVSRAVSQPLDALPSQSP
jgi:hypothetical protein